MKKTIFLLAVLMLGFIAMSTARANVNADTAHANQYTELNKAYKQYYLLNPIRDRLFNGELNPICMRSISFRDMAKLGYIEVNNDYLNGLRIQIVETTDKDTAIISVGGTLFTQWKLTTVNGCGMKKGTVQNITGKTYEFFKIEGNNRRYWVDIQ